MCVCVCVCARLCNCVCLETSTTKWPRPDLGSCATKINNWKFDNLNYQSTLHSIKHHSMETYVERKCSYMHM